MAKNTFFIIEDHTLTNAGIKQLLEEKAGAQCLGTAFTKQDAEEKLLSKDSNQNKVLPDVIILDLVLGNDSGIELLRELHSAYPSMKILIYSMYSKPGIISLALEEGAQGFVEKSASEKVLISAFRTILSGETFIQQNLVSPLFTYKTLYDGLTRQEQKILKRILEQKTREQIAEEMNIVVRTVDNYLSRIFEKTGCKGIEDIFNKFAR